LAVDVPYYTYTYSNNGTALISPHAYLPGRLYDGRFDEAAGGFSKPSDIAVGPENRMYIADSGNDRVVILNEDFTFYHEIRDFYNEGAGGADAFSNPEGLFVDGEGKLYVADTDNARIVMFNADLSFRGIIRQPDAEVLPENFIYRPSALAVNRAEHIYVVSKSTIMGILELDVHSEFYGFIGAQRTRGNIWSIFWRNFMTAEQKARTFRNIPSEYNSLVIDQQGFLYATTSTIYWGNLYYAAMNKDKSSHLSPVKRFNPTGIDVMVRNGVFPTLGEIDIPLGDVRNPVYGPSVIADVALTDHGIFSLLDTRRNKIFTYTNQGELLYAFGLKSRQDGNTLAATAIVYMGHDLLVLDKDTGYIQKYDQTEYGAKLFEVIGLFENRNYERSVSLWKDILEDNGNLDIAYVGFGKSLLLDGKYAEAMDMFKSAGSVEQYSNAFKEYRKEFVEKNLGWILLAILAALAAVMLFFRFCKKVNDENKKPKARIGRLGKEMAFSMHVIFHPFDGFWDIKHEKRGSFVSATAIMALSIIVNVLSSASRGYIRYQRTFSASSLFTALLQVFLPYIVFCIANWCLTTLMNGEGTMKDIYTVVCYAQAPIIIITVLTTVAGNFLIMEEMFLIGFFEGLAFLWTLILIFFGMITVHNYTLPKNIIVTVFSLGGMVLILFLGVLFFDVIQIMYSYFRNIYQEIAFRL